KLERVEGPPARRLDVGGTLDQYGTARGSEGSFFAQASAQVAEPLVLSAGYEQLHQFGFVDHRINATAYLRASESLLLSGRFAFSPGAQTVAHTDTSGSAELRFASFVSGLVTVRHLAFSDNGVTIVGPGVRLDFGAASLLLQAGAVFSTVNSTQGYGQGRFE